MPSNRQEEAARCYEPDSQPIRDWGKVFDCLPGLFALVDPDRRILKVNRGLADSLGISQEECLGRQWVELLRIPSDSDLLLAVDCSSNRDAAEAECRFGALDGWFVVRVAPICRDDGSLEAKCVTLRDVSAQHTAERELRDTQKWLLLALESGRVGTWDWDVDSDRVRFVSIGSYAAGRSVDQRETTGADWFRTTHPDDIPDARALIDRVVNGSAEAFSVTVRMNNGESSEDSWRWVHSRGRAAERDELGHATRLVGVYEDVTEGVRRAEIEEEQVEMMARASRLNTLGALASSLSHEINQPLAALTSYIEASLRLFDKGESYRSETRRALERSLTLAGKASEVVQRVRRLLRRERPLVEKIAVPELLYSVRNQMTREARGLDGDIEVAGNSEAEFIAGDRVQIEQILTNLVRNGLEAAAEAKRERPLVTLESRVVGDQVEMRVSDNGPGIPNSQSDLLFRPFFTTKQGGSGLGLVICESLAELHGGRIRLERSTPGGATFVVEFPIRPKEETVDGR